MTQYILPIKRKFNYNLDDFIFSESTSELKEVLDNLHLRWGYNPYSEIILLIGAPKSGKTHFSHILKSQNPNILILDDIDKNFSEEDLLYRFNTCHETRRPVLFIGREDQNFKLPDLKSRLASVKIVYISPPDDKMVGLLLVKALTERSIKVTNDVIKFLLARIPRSYEAVEKVVEQIDMLSLEQKRNINVSFLSSLNMIQLL